MNTVIVESNDDFKKLSELTGLSAEKLKEMTESSPELEGLKVSVADAEDNAPTEKCAKVNFKLAGVPFEAALCVGINGEGVAYTVKLTVLGITIVNAHGEWTRGHESTSYSADYKLIKGTLTVGVNSWSEHYCPFISWDGSVGVGPFKKSIHFNKQPFCLR